MATGAAQFVIAISVDGLHPDAISTLGQESTPNFHRLQAEGAFTNNARTDAEYSVTLPNHASQMTGRPVEGANGHGLTDNVDRGGTLHDLHGSYVPSVFDVVHDHGMSTALFVSKQKFALFDRSWDGTGGAVDSTGQDDGRDKIDIYRYRSDTQELVQEYLSTMASGPFAFSMLHLRDPDTAGHTFGWMTPDYLASVEQMDARLGEIMAFVDTDGALQNKTAIILTTDHGGLGFTHTDSSIEDNYSIPFYVWGPEVRPRGDLYEINPTIRADPDETQPPGDESPPPIRNGELANLALDLLGLPAIGGSMLNENQGLQTDSTVVGRWWHNSSNQFDVNADGSVFPIDVLLVINALNKGGGARTLSEPQAGESVPPPFVDVSGDDFLAPIDVLLIINELNRPVSQGEGEMAESWMLALDALSVDLFFSRLLQVDGGTVL